MTMRRAFKHQFRVRLFRRSRFGNEFGPWMTFSVRLNRPWPNALNRVLKNLDRGAPDGWRYVID